MNKVGCIDLDIYWFWIKLENKNEDEYYFGW